GLGWSTCSCRSTRLLMPCERRCSTPSRIRMLGEEQATLHIQPVLGYRSCRMDSIGWSPSWSTSCPLLRSRLWEGKGCWYEGRQGFRLRGRDRGEALATPFGDLCAQRDPGSRARWPAVAPLC